MKRLLALANLGAHFALHVLLALPRALGLGRRGGAEFRAQFAREGIFPLSPAEVDALPRHQACISCGLCDMGPGPSEPRPYPRWALAAGVARALPTLPVPPADATRPIARSAESLCPLGVPLADVADFLTRPRA